MNADDLLLDDICAEIAAVFGNEFPIDSIRVDVDLFDDEVGLIEGRPMDSLDLIEVVAAVEDRFATSLEAILDDPTRTVTLRIVRDAIAAARSTAETARPPAGAPRA